MLLWDIIRDFFVENIFGGVTSTGRDYSGLIGTFSNGDFDYIEGNTQSTLVNVGSVVNSDYDQVLTHLTLGDWLSTTFTIITLILICIFLYLFVKWIFKLFAGLLSRN